MLFWQGGCRQSCQKVPKQGPHDTLMRTYAREPQPWCKGRGGSGLQSWPQGPAATNQMPPHVLEPPMPPGARCSPPGSLVAAKRARREMLTRPLESRPWQSTSSVAPTSRTSSTARICKEGKRHHPLAGCRGTGLKHQALGQTATCLVTGGLQMRPWNSPVSCTAQQ